jgi:hypothetical protein
MKIFGACVPNFVYCPRVIISRPNARRTPAAPPSDLKTMLDIELLGKEWIAP